MTGFEVLGAPHFVSLALHFLYLTPLRERLRSRIGERNSRESYTDSASQNTGINVHVPTLAPASEFERLWLFRTTRSAAARVFLNGLQPQRVRLPEASMDARLGERLVRQTEEFCGTWWPQQI